MNTAGKLRQRILEIATLVGFEYKGKRGYVDPFSKKNFDVFFDGKTYTANSIDEVMNSPYFDGHSLSEICDEITITEGM